MLEGSDTVGPINYVTARRQDGQKRLTQRKLHKVLLIQQDFAPLSLVSPLLPFGFPRSQCPAGARPDTHGAIKQGFWPCLAKTSEQRPFWTAIGGLETSSRPVSGETGQYLLPYSKGRPPFYTFCNRRVGAAPGLFWGKAQICTEWHSVGVINEAFCNRGRRRPLQSATGAADTIYQQLAPGSLIPTSRPTASPGWPMATPSSLRGPGDFCAKSPLLGLSAILRTEWQPFDQRPSTASQACPDGPGLAAYRGPAHFVPKWAF